MKAIPSISKLLFVFLFSASFIGCGTLGDSTKDESSKDEARTQRPQPQLLERLSALELRVKALETTPAPQMPPQGFYGPPQGVQPVVAYPQAVAPYQYPSYPVQPQPVYFQPAPQPAASSYRPPAPPAPQPSAPLYPR